MRHMMSQYRRETSSSRPKSTGAVIAGKPREIGRMDGSRFDGFTKDLAHWSGTRRRLVPGVIMGLLGGTIVPPVVHEVAAGGKCHKGDHTCHGKCCPSRGPVCCKHGCCKQGFRCCN